MPNIYRLKVDLKLKQTGKVPTFVQYDTARLEFQIYDDGKPLDLTPFTSVEFAHKLPNGSFLLADGEIESDTRGSYVSYDYQGSEMEKLGFIETSFSLLNYNTNKKISVQPFKVNIVSDLRESAVDPASPEFGKLQQYIAQFEGIKGRMETAIQASEASVRNIQGIVTSGNQIIADMSTLKTDLNTVKTDTTKVKNDTLVVKNEASQAIVNANKATTDANKAATDTLAVKQQADTLIPQMEQAKTNTEEATTVATTAAQNTLKAIADAEAIAKDWTFKGGYNLDTAYKKTNVISFNGEGYIAKKDSQGVAPTGLENDPNWTLISRKGQDGSGVLSTYREVFTATEGQRVFTTKHPYDQLQSRLKVTVGGVLQSTPENFMETTSTSFTFNGGLPAGTKVVVEYYSKAPVLSPDIQQQIDQLNNVVQFAEMDVLKEQGDYAKEQADIAKVQNANQLTQITDVAGTMEYIQDNFLPDIALAQSEFELATDAKITELDDRVEAGIGAFTEDTEVVAARGGEVNLGTRLNKVTQQLAETATKEEARLKSVKITQTDVSEELLQQIAGTAAINAVPANKSLTASKFTDKAIEQQHTTFLETGKNLFNYEARSAGQTLSNAGALVASADYNVTPFIPVTEGVSITLNNPRLAFYYDANKVVVGTKVDNAGNYNLTLTPPAGVSYIRAAIYHSFTPTFQIEKGTVATAFEPYKVKINKINIKGENLEFDAVQGKNIDENAISPRNVDFIQEGKNLYDKSKAVVGSFLQETSGAFLVNANFSTSSFQRVKAGNTYTINAVRKFVSYDLNQTYLSGLNQTQGAYTFTAEKDGYIRFSYDHTLSTDVQMEIGSTVTPFSKYEIKIPNLSPISNENSPVNPLTGKRLYTFGDSIMKGAGNGNIGIYELIAQKYGVTGANYAVSGASITYYSDRSHVVAQIQSAIAAGISPDFLVMNGGINDVTFNVLGEIAADYDYVKNGFASFSAGLEYCFGLLKTTFPDVPLIYVWVHRMGSRLTPDQLAHRKRALEIAEKWSVTVVDMYKEGGMNMFIPGHMEAFTFYPTETSGTHPNADGYNLFYIPRIVSEMRRVSP